LIIVQLNKKFFTFNGLVTNYKHELLGNEQKFIFVLLRCCRVNWGSVLRGVSLRPVAEPRSIPLAVGHGTEADHHHMIHLDEPG